MPAPGIPPAKRAAARPRAAEKRPPVVPQARFRRDGRSAAARARGPGGTVQPARFLPRRRAGSRSRRHRPRALSRRQAPYSASVTCSSQSTDLPSRCSPMAMWLIAVVGAAPCQCRSPGGTRPRRRGGCSAPARPGLDEPAPGGDDQDLPERMGVPGRPRAGLEGHEAAARPRRRLGLEQRFDPDRPGEMFGRRLARRPGAASDHVHELVLLCSRNRRGGPDPPARTASAPRGAPRARCR